VNERVTVECILDGYCKTGKDSVSFEDRFNVSDFVTTAMNLPVQRK